jgi:hypothetical protein
MKNKFGVELEKVNPGRRVLLALDAGLFREEAEVEGVMANHSGNFVSIYVRRSDGTRARVGFEQVAEIVTARRKAA